MSEVVLMCGLVSLILSFLLGQPMGSSSRRQVREENKIRIFILLAPSQGTTWDYCVCQRWHSSTVPSPHSLLCPVSELLLPLALSGLGVGMTLRPTVTGLGVMGYTLWSAYTFVNSFSSII